MLSIVLSIICFFLGITFIIQSPKKEPNYIKSNKNHVYEEIQRYCGKHLIYLSLFLGLVGLFFYFYRNPYFFIYELILIGISILFFIISLKKYISKL